MITKRMLPQTEEQFKSCISTGHFQYSKCISCHSPFSSTNTHSDMGWRETQLSGLCEDCFDSLCKEDEEEEDEPS
jgi:hypothetical protein